MFTKNRDRLLTTDMSRKVMAAILAHPEVEPLLSDEHFSVDGTLVKAWASMKSFQPKDGAPPDRDDDPGDPPPPPTQQTAADTDHQPRQTETQPSRPGPGRASLEMRRPSAHPLLVSGIRGPRLPKKTPQRH